VSVANSRQERGKSIAQLVGMSHGGLVRELEAWTITQDEIRDEARELRQRRSEARTMVELIAGELRNRRGAVPTSIATSVAPASEAAAS
jgi:hypothetical protein